MTNVERYLLGLLSAALALGQVTFLVLFLGALIRLIPFPEPAVVFLVLFVGAGLHIAALIVIPYVASDRIPPDQRFAWNRAIRSFGPIALLAIWWRFIRPSPGGAV
jgi:hypothetical protein